MANKVLLQTLLFGLALSEWIEITRVGNSNTKPLDGSSKASQTFPNYEQKPLLYEITTKDEDELKITENLKGETRYSDEYEVEVENYPTSSESEESLTKNRDINESQIERNNVVNQSKNENSDDYYEDDDEEEDGSEENVASGFMPLIKNVQNQLLDFKGRTLNAKIEHLEKLRDNILYEIKYRISNLFKPPEKATSDSRLYKDYYSDEHHLDYPSNEGALMTIGFLTFAVFLIKLVLKLIYSLKLKQQYYAQTTTTPASIFLKRSEREIKEDGLAESATRILRYVEEYAPS